MSQEISRGHLSADHGAVLESGALELFLELQAQYSQPTYERQRNAKMSGGWNTST